MVEKEYSINACEMSGKNPYNISYFCAIVTISGLFNILPFVSGENAVTCMSWSRQYCTSSSLLMYGCISI